MHYGCISKSEVEVRAKTANRKGVITKDTGWVVIQVGSAALKATWRNYSALELEVTCAVWSLETLAYYLDTLNFISGPTTRHWPRP